MSGAAAAGSRTLGFTCLRIEALLTAAVQSPDGSVGAPGSGEPRHAAVSGILAGVSGTGKGRRRAPELLYGTAGAWSMLGRQASRGPALGRRE